MGAILAKKSVDLRWNMSNFLRELNRYFYREFNKTLNYTSGSYKNNDQGPNMLNLTLNGA